MTDGLAAGSVEIDDNHMPVRVRFALPQEWFTVDELRAFGSYLLTVADEAAPSPELEKLTGILEMTGYMTQSARGAARAILRSGYKLTEIREGNRPGEG